MDDRILVDLGKIEEGAFNVLADDPVSSFFSRGLRWRLLSVRWNVMFPNGISDDIANLTHCGDVALLPAIQSNGADF